MHLDSTGCITRFTAPGAPGGELLAWSRTTAGVPKLKVLGSIGTTLSEVTLEFPTLCDQTALPTLPVALVAGDYDGENGEELLIAHEADHTAIVLANTGQSPWFVTNNEGRFDVIALTGLMSSQPNVGIPAFAQVDDQTAEDIVIPTGSYVEVFTSLPHIRALGSTFYRSSDIVMRESEYGADVDVDTLPSGELRFAFWIPGTAPYHLYTHLKVTIWHQDSPGASNYVESQALYRRYHPLVLPPNIEANQQQWVPLELGFPDGGCWNPLEYYYTQFRFVKLDEVPEPDVEVAASPTFTGGFTLKKICGDMYDMTFYDYLRQRGIPDTDFLVFGDNDLDGVTWPLNGSTFVGAYVPMSSQPPFQENVVLTFPPLGVGRDTARVGEPAPPP